MYETNSNTALNYNNMTATEVVGARVPEVQSEMNRIAETTEYLDKCLQDLENRLSSVLAQHKVAGTDAQTAPSPLRVPLAETLHINGNHLENLRERVTSMISRLEL